MAFKHRPAKGAKGSNGDCALPIMNENETASTNAARKRQFGLQLLFKCEFEGFVNILLILGISFCALIFLSSSLFSSSDRVGKTAGTDLKLMRGRKTVRRAGGW